MNTDQVKRELKRRLVMSKWESRRESEQNWQEKFDEHQYEIERLEAALLAVRDWMHEPMFLSRPMRDPRVILRKVEEAL